MRLTDQMTDGERNVFDWALVSAAGAAVLEFVPPVTAVFVLLLAIVRLYETRTVQRILRGKKRDDE